MAAPIQTIFSTVPLETKCLFGGVVAASSILLLLRSSLTAEDLKGVFGAGQDSLLVFPWMICVPGYVLWRPWTLLTAGLVESNLLETLFSATTLLLAGRYLQRFWKSTEFLKFVTIVVAGSNLIAVVVSIIEHIVLRGAGEFLYGQAFHGLTALQVGFLVAFTQLIPEHQVQLLGGLLKLKVKQLPMLYVTFSNVMCIIGYQCPYILIQFGWLISWVWLRFYKEGGDRSETFAFATWFPPFIQPYVGKLSNFVFPLAVRFKLIRPWHDLETGLSTSQGNARAEAERRRAMALQALDQRMATSHKANAGARAASPQTTLTTPPVAATSASTAEAGPSQQQKTEASTNVPDSIDDGAAEKGGEVVFDSATPDQPPLEGPPAAADSKTAEESSAAASQSKDTS